MFLSDFINDISHGGTRHHGDDRQRVPIFCTMASEAAALNVIVLKVPTDAIRDVFQ